uniref:RING-type domain-containing protein n=1 Tax=Ciona intestinalis TaxID=7719 RepID=F6QH43_CIOIN
MDNSVLHCLQQLQKVVECSICLETMTNPVQTKCNHSFCSHCIHKAMAERPSFKCPLCKTAISKRSLKKSSYLTEVISTLTTLNKSAHKEMHVEGFTEPKSTEKELGVLKKGNNSRNMLKKSATPEQPPGFAEEHSQVEDMNLIPRTEDQLTPDLLDFVETTKSPNGVKLDPKSTKSSKLNLDKSAKKVADNVAGGSANTESADTNPDELYDFPQSQPSTRGKVPVKKTRKAITKKSAKKLIWDKSVTANQSRKKQEKGKKAKTSSPPLPVKSPTDIKIIENIKETESHKLVIEKRRTGRSSSIEKSKQT